jgi:peptidyl-prolyl cis-trans isomerase SurA
MQLIRLIIFSLIFFTPLKAIESYIEFKVNDEIITNVDLDTERRYLIALNNELKNTDKKILLRLAKESIIREKIKKNELLKYYELDSSQDYIDDVIENFYKKLNIKNLNEFEAYLSDYNLKLKNVKDKIQIQLLWKSLIGEKYSDQMNINEEKLKKKIEENSDAKEFDTEYELSEIIFQINDTAELSNQINLIQEDIKKQGFKNAATIHSISDSSKFGGNIGLVNESKLSKEIANAIVNLEIGEISLPIKIANGFLLLKIVNKKQKQIQIDKKQLLEQAINFETNKQYNQFSIIYFNKIKLNSIISE